MSETKTEVALRFQVEGVKPHSENFYRLCKEFFKKSPDDVCLDEGYCYYDPNLNGGWTVSLPVGKIFFDRHLTNGDEDAGGFQVDLQLMDLVKEVEDFDQRLEKLSIPLEVVDAKVTILHFYNGACSGLGEVE